MVKVKKKGKPGKKNIQDDKLSFHEKEMYNQSIASFEHKISWRNHLSDIIEEDIKDFTDMFDAEQSDKMTLVKLLEEAIAEEKNTTERICEAILEAEKCKSEIEESMTRELALKLKTIQEENIEHDTQLEALKMELCSLETFNVENAEEKVKRLEKELNEEEDSEDALQRAVVQDKKRQDAFRMHMIDSLKAEANLFQKSLVEQQDENYNRISEETRWWLDQANSLQTATDRLESSNEKFLVSLKSNRNQLSQKNDIVSQTYRQIQENEKMISDLAAKNKDLEELAISALERDKLISEIQNRYDSAEIDLVEVKKNLMRNFACVRETEEELKVLEDRLVNETSFGKDLGFYIKKAQAIIEEDAKECLIVTYNGPPDEKETILELRTLFEEATNFVCNRESRSLL